MACTQGTTSLAERSKPQDRRTESLYYLSLIVGNKAGQRAQTRVIPTKSVFLYIHPEAAHRRATYPRVVRRDGGVVPPTPPFGEPVRQERIAHHAAIVAAQRLLMCRIACTRLLDRLLAGAADVLTEVYGSGWSPDRWVPFVFPSSLLYAPEVLSSSNVTPGTAWSYVQHAPPVWRPNLSPALWLLPRGIFSASNLAHIDAFGALFAPELKCPPWLIAIIQLLHALRAFHAELPSTLTSLPRTPIAPPLSNPSQSYRYRRHGPLRNSRCAILASYSLPLPLADIL